MIRRSVSKLVLGTVQFGCQYGINSEGRPDREAVSSILKEACHGGITTLDTSSAYGDSEEVLGDSIGGLDFKIVSKYISGDGPAADAIEGSLKRLKRHSLFGYILHHFQDWVDNPAIWDDFMALKLQGKTDKIGFSLYSPSELETILERGIEFDLLQFPRNIFDRQFDPYLPELKRRGVEIHVRSTFLQGLFFMDRSRLPERLQPLRKYLLELDSFAGQKGLSIAQTALNFNLQNRDIDGVLIGVDNVAQLKANLDSVTDISIETDFDIVEKELLNPVNWK